GDEIEQRGFAGAVRTDDQPALAGFDRQIDAAGDAETAERFAQTADGECAHGIRSTDRTTFGRLILRTAERNSRATPGTRPSGMNTTMATKIAPSMKFQRTT